MEAAAMAAKEAGKQDLYCPICKKKFRRGHTRRPLSQGSI